MAGNNTHIVTKTWREASGRVLLVAEAVLHSVQRGFTDET